MERRCSWCGRYCSDGGGGVDEMEEEEELGEVRSWTGLVAACSELVADVL